MRGRDHMQFIHVMPGSNEARLTSAAFTLRLSLSDFSFSY